MTSKKRAVIICPGRGCYNKEQLGYLQQHHQDKQQTLAIIDTYRTQQGYESVTSLDGMDKFMASTHTSGENAAGLIYASAICDQQAIDLNQYEVCAITGNSMGWYIALAAANALSPAHAIELITSMGAMMKDQLIGGQLIYPVSDEHWMLDQTRRAQVIATIKMVNSLAEHQLYLSIDLGPFLVIAGCENGLAQFNKRIEPLDNYPMRLLNHGAFHTPMLEAQSQNALAQHPAVIFNKPNVPLIDGNGTIWSPYSSDTTALHQYTLSQQVVAPYYFNTAIDVAIKEFAPEVFIVLGPGNSLSSSIAQQLIALKWQGITNKEQFMARQKNNPIIVAMGMPAQRQLVTIE